MGTDIHAYLDYDFPSDCSDSVGTSGFGRFRISRDYTLFSLIAGVRGGFEPVVEPRGLPEKVSYQVENDNRLYVLDEGAEEVYEEGVVSRQTAEEWVDDGSSKYMPGSDKRFVTHPDWHTHTWLTTAELKEVLRRYDTDLTPWRWGDTVMTLKALIGAMEGIESCAGYKARLVVWFDN